MNKYQKGLVALCGVFAVVGIAFGAARQLSDGRPDGTTFGQSSTDKISFYNATTAAQPSGASQAALTDSSGGTASATTGVSANAAKETVIIPLGQLSLLVNGFTWKVALPYAYSVSSALFRVGAGVSTGSKAATVTLGVNGSAMGGGVISLTSATATPSGQTITATTITGTNTGTAGQTIDAAITGVTAFTEGTGWIELTVVNVDKANQAATFAALGNALRSALVTLGLAKGSS